MTLRTSLFVSIVAFWSILLVVFSIIGYSLEITSDYSTELTEDKISSEGFNILSIGKSITFIFRVMFWQIPNNIMISPWVSVFLNMVAIFSIYVFVDWLRGG